MQHSRRVVRLAEELGVSMYILGLTGAQEVNGGARWKQGGKRENCDEQKQVTKGIHAVGAKASRSYRLVHYYRKSRDESGGKVSGPNPSNS